MPVAVSHRTTKPGRPFLVNDQDDGYQDQGPSTLARDVSALSGLNRSIVSVTSGAQAHRLGGIWCACTPLVRPYELRSFFPQISDFCLSLGPSFSQA